MAATLGAPRRSKGSSTRMNRVPESSVRAHLAGTERTLLQGRLDQDDAGVETGERVFGAIADADFVRFTEHQLWHRDGVRAARPRWSSWIVRAPSANACGVPRNSRATSAPTTSVAARNRRRGQPFAH